MLLPRYASRGEVLRLLYNQRKEAAKQAIYPEVKFIK